MAQWFYNRALAPSTQRTYNSAQSRYVSFCSSFNLSPLPLTQSGLCKFVAFLATEGVAHKSIKGYLSALRHWHISSCGSDPNINSLPTLAYVLQGVKRVQTTSGSNKPRVRLPITSAVMRLLKGAWERQHQGPSFNHKMLWAVACTCFFGFFAIWGSYSSIAISIRPRRPFIDG